MSSDEDEAVVDVEEPLIFQDETHHHNLLHSLNTMRKNRTFCDVILHVGNIELYGHRAVLASVSAKLMELFSVDDEQESANPQGHTVQITLNLNSGFGASTLEKVIEYAYTSRLELQGHEVRSIYLAACYLKMNRIAEECAKYLIKNLSVDNCIDIRCLPGISSKKSFVCQLDDFISTLFPKVCQSASFLALPCVQIEILTQTRHEMNLVPSDSLSRMVMDWIKKSFATNTEYSFTYNTFVDKTHMLYLAVDNSLQDCSHMPTGDVSDTQLVQEYKKMSKKPSPNLQNGQRIGHMQSAKPRVLIYNKELADSRKQDVDSDWLVIATDKVTEYTFLSLVVLNERLTRMSIMLRLNEQEEVVTTPLESRSSSHESLPDTYCSLSGMSSGKCAAGCTTLNGSIFVCGGYDRVECIKSVEKYNAEENTWEMLPAMLEARGRFGICKVDNCIYAVGGCNGTTELSTVECYNPEKEKWTRISPLPTAKSNSGICTLDGKIYCIGGWNGQFGIKQCDVYDPKTNKWSSIAPLQTGRYQAGVCAYNGLVYAVGGCNSWNCLNTVEVYDPLTDTWTYAKPLVTARRGCGLIEYNDKLFVVGGCDGSSSLDSVEIFDSAVGEWRLGPSLTIPRSNVGVAVLNERLYAVGGFSGKKFLNSIEYLDESINKWTSFMQRSCPSSLTTSLHEDELQGHLK